MYTSRAVQITVSSRKVAAVGTSAVPERFRGTSTAIPGRSTVPPELRGTSAPAIAGNPVVPAADGGGSAEDDQAGDGA
jgi:hypothetical protein